MDDNLNLLDEFYNYDEELDDVVTTPKRITFQIFANASDRSGMMECDDETKEEILQAWLDIVKEVIE